MPCNRVVGWYRYATTGTASHTAVAGCFIMAANQLFQTRPLAQGLNTAIHTEPPSHLDLIPLYLDRSSMRVTAASAGIRISSGTLTWPDMFSRQAATSDRPMRFMLRQTIFLDAG